MTKNCAGANDAWTGALGNGVPLMEALSLKRRSPVTGALPKISISRPVLRGTTCCLTISRPSGSRTMGAVAAAGGRLRNATPCVSVAVRWVLQLDGDDNA